MAFTVMQCPNCHGEIQVDDTREYGFCMYCGSKIQLKTTIEIEGINSKNSMLQRAEAFKRVQEYERAMDTYIKILDFYPDCKEALYGIVYFDNNEDRLSKWDFEINKSFDFIMESITVNDNVLQYDYNSNRIISVFLLNSYDYSGSSGMFAVNSFVYWMFNEFKVTQRSDIDSINRFIESRISHYGKDKYSGQFLMLASEEEKWEFFDFINKKKEINRKRLQNEINSIFDALEKYGNIERKKNHRISASKIQTVPLQIQNIFNNKSDLMCIKILYDSPYKNTGIMYFRFFENGFSKKLGCIKDNKIIFIKSIDNEGNVYSGKRIVAKLFIGEKGLEIEYINVRQEIETALNNNNYSINADSERIKRLQGKHIDTHFELYNDVSALGFCLACGNKILGDTISSSGTRRCRHCRFKIKNYIIKKYTLL